MSWDGVRSWAASCSRALWPLPRRAASVDPPRAWTLVGVEAFYDHRCLVEIEALAVLD